MAKSLKKPPKPKSLLKVSLRGEEIGRSGAVPVPLLIKICEAIQSAVNKQAEAVGLSPSDCTLELVRLGKGSAILEFELTRPQTLLSGQQETGEQAVSDVVKTVRQIGAKKQTAEEYDPAVLTSLKLMAKVVGPNLKIAFSVPQERTGTTEGIRATFTTKTAERVQAMLPKQMKAQNRIVEGIVEMADFKPSDHRFRLVSLYGSPILCEFSDELSVSVHDLTRSVARVSGIADTDSNGKVVSFRVERIAPRTSSITGDFWQEKTISQLISEQNIKPLKSIADLEGIWPENEPKPN
jgi:hypothetical protein